MSITKQELIMLQSLPLDIKVMKTKQRICEWINFYEENGVYVSFSGGKDSIVLLDLVRQVNPNILGVYIDTGLEYPEIKQFVKSVENIQIIRPELSFKQVIEKYGYPMVSKQQAQYIHEYKHTKSSYMKMRRMQGDSKGRFKISEKYKYLVNAPFDISHKCCDKLKKEPIKKYEKDTGRVPFIGTHCDDSILRMQQYLKNGCNSFLSKRPMSKPLSFWKETDIIEYIKINELNYPSVYGEIVIDENNNYKFSKLKGTGCIFCGFGVQLEKEPNRFQKLEKSHPQLYNYCMNKLGFKEVCDYMNIPYKNDNGGELNVF